ncbi:hypothetical protein MRX96_037256 [Rhipicephalus microplus]
MSNRRSVIDIATPTSYASRTSFTHSGRWPSNFQAPLAVPWILAFRAAVYHGLAIITFGIHEDRADEGIDVDLRADRYSIGSHPAQDLLSLSCMKDTRTCSRVPLSSSRLRAKVGRYRIPFALNA